MPKTPHNTERAYKVRITVQYDAMVFVRPGDNIDDRVADIDLPENTQCKYVTESMETDRILESLDD